MDADNVTRLRMALGRISRQVDRQVSRGSLSATQVTVLGTIARRGPIRVSDLAEFENLNPTMLSRILGKLETAELVTRCSDPGDGRAVQVAATATGAKLDRQLRAERTALFAAKLAELPPAEAAVVIAALPALESLAERFQGLPAASSRGGAPTVGPRAAGARR
jgi:DNA-binding MarR family transcriptional regulator